MSDKNGLFWDVELNTEGAIKEAKELTQKLKDTANAVDNVSKETKTAMKEATSEFEKANKAYDKQKEKVEALRESVDALANSMPLSKEYQTETKKLNSLLEKEADLFKKLEDIQNNVSGMSAKAQKTAEARTKSQLVALQKEISAQRELVGLVEEDNKYDTSKADAELERLNAEEEKLKEIAELQKEAGEKAVATIQQVVNPSIDDLVAKISEASEEVAEEVREQAIQENWVTSQVKSATQLPPIDTTGAIDPLAPNIDEEALDRYLSKVQGLRGIFSNLKYNISEAFTPIRNAIASNEMLANTATTVVTTFGNVRGKISSLGAVFKIVGKASVSAIGNIVSGLKAIGQKAVSAGKSLVAMHKSSSGGFKGGLKSLVRYGLGISGLFMLFNKLRRAITEGMGNLAKFDSNTNKSISGVTSALATLKNALATAFAPILNIVAPILTSFINKLVEVANTIGAVLAKLTGKSSFSKAIAVQKDYAKSLDNTSKSAKGSTLSIDELNQSVDESEGGAGASGMFEETAISDEQSEMADHLKDMWANADFTDLGAMFGDKLANSLDNIDWGKIKVKAGNIGKSLATFLNGVVETPSLGKKIGKGIAEAFNTGVEFLSGFIKNAHWDSIGSFISDGIMGAITGLDIGKITGLLGDGIKAIFDLGSGLLDGIDWRNLPKILWQKLLDAITGIDYAGIAKSFGGFLGQAVKASLEWTIGLKDWIKEGVLKIKDYFADYIKEYIDQTGETSLGWAIVHGVFNGIVDALKNIGQWILDNIFTPFIDGFKEAFGIHSPSTVMTEMGVYIIEGLFNGLIGLWERVKSIFEDFKANLSLKIEEIKKNVSEKFSTLKTNVVDVFTKLKTSVVEIFTNLGTAIKKPINAILSAVELFVNHIINGVNMAIDAMNSLQFDVPDWVPIVGGNSLSLNIPRIPNVELPRLATGTVIPRQSREFTAILGDNNRETEVVSPLSTIQQAVAEVLTPYLEEIARNTDKLVDKDFNTYIGDREIALSARRGQKQLGYVLSE